MNDPEASPAGALRPTDATESRVQPDDVQLAAQLSYETLQPVSGACRGSGRDSSSGAANMSRRMNRTRRWQRSQTWLCEVPDVSIRVILL
jgi:hypothetical protein